MMSEVCTLKRVI